MNPTTPIVLERDNVNDESVKLRWRAKHGEKVTCDTVLAEVETSKANVEVYAPADGFLVWEFPEGADVPVSSQIGHIAETAPTEPARFTRDPVKRSQPATPQSTHATGAQSEHASAPEFASSMAYPQRFSPVAAKMMEEHGLKAADFPGRSAVRKQDVLEFLNPAAAQSETVRPTETAANAAKITQPYKVVALSKMKRRERSTLAAGVGNAIQSAVSVTCFTQGLRRILDANPAIGSASAVILYEVSRLLRKYPALNATYRDHSLLQYEQVNLGYAMDDGRGLKVAVLQNCDALSLQQITSDLRDLTVAYVDDKLTPAQLAHATFTISDLSGMGVSSFYPLISENQGAILGIGGEQFAPGSLYGSYILTLTFDHQLSDGRTAALFLGDLKSRLQSYEDTAQAERQEMRCSQCGRTETQLAESREYLLRSVAPEGYLCTLCAAGY
jgi:pyruvate/2-oxoglutarate dehydrogenase complex dihydrolipoamide acyltransferase (E2) component